MEEEVGSDGSENSDDLGVHGLFNHSRNATTMTPTGAGNNDTGDAEKHSGRMQVNEGDGKNEEDSDNLGITGLFQ
jgi:ribosomal protein L12E/L44/L45/RPP1/RPP2